MTTRRLFLRNTGLILAAPAIIKVADIMPIKAQAEELQFFHYESQVKFYVGRIYVFNHKGPFIVQWSSLDDPTSWDTGNMVTLDYGGLDAAPEYR